MCLHGGIGSATRQESLPEAGGFAAAKCVDALGPGMKRGGGDTVLLATLRRLQGHIPATQRSLRPRDGRAPFRVAKANIERV